MRWFFILIAAGLMLLKTETSSFACGGCLFGSKAGESFFKKKQKTIRCKSARNI